MWILLVSALAAASPPSAPPSDAPVAADEAEVKRARELFESAQVLYRQKKFAAAVVKFEEAYAARPHPVVLFNIARSYEQLGKVSEALQRYREYLRVAQGTKEQEQVLQSVTALEKKLRDQGVQQLTVITEPPQANVSINGREVGRGPVTTDLAEGQLAIRVTAEGYLAQEQRYTHQLVRASEIRIVLAPAPKPPPAPPPSAPAPVAELPRTVPAPAGAVAVVAPAGEAPLQRGGFRFKWVAGGAALVSAGAGGALWMDATSSRNRMVYAEAPLSHDEVQGLAGRASTSAFAGNAALATAGALAVATVVLFLLDR